MIFLVLVARSAADLCPQFPGVRSLYNSAANVTVSPNASFFFYSSFNPLGDTLTVRLRPDKSTVSLVKGVALDCPTPYREPTLLEAHPGVVSEVSLPLSDEFGFAVFMLFVTEPTDVIVSVAGENPNNADVGEWRLLAILYLTSVLLLLVALFVHAILARGRVHYKVDLTANE